MDALGILARCIAVYLAGVLIFLFVMHTWLALDPRRSPRARPFRALVSELGWAAATEWTLPLAFFLWPLWWKRPRRPVDAGPQPADPGGQGQLPVVLVHGWGQNRADFWGLGWRLRRQGARPVYAFNYFFFGRVEKSAARLGRVVDRALREQGATRVHLVCHSLGGLAARFFVERAGGATKVASIVFIGSPLAGTRRALTGIGPAARQMAPKSAFLEALGPPAPPDGVRYWSAWSHSDALVVPADSARLLGRGAELELDHTGHLGILYSGQVARQVDAWLAEAERPV